MQSYEDTRNQKKKDGAILSLKQVWMDKVDMQKGNSSIKAMAMSQQGAFVTLINAFLAVKDSADVDKIDLNDVVKRILKPRIAEFNTWVVESEKELKKRYEIERTYLKTQVNNLKLYAQWARPYFRAAQQLSSKESGKNAAIVNTFNTILLELTLLGKNKIDVKKSSISGDLPAEFANEKFLRKLKRTYNSCILVDFKFRGIPQRVSQQPHYVFGGRAEVTYRAYVLTDDEIAKLNKEIENSDVNDTLKLIEGTTTESLGALQEDINFFLQEKEKEEKSEKKSDESNPFLALIGNYNDKSETKSKESGKKADTNLPAQKDSFVEEQIRNLAAKNAVTTAFGLFDIYKKAHGMASFT